MPWLAELVDGPLAGETFQIDDDLADTPPPHIRVKGCRYRYCGWRDSSPRYSYHGEGGGNGGGRSPLRLPDRQLEKATRPTPEPGVAGASIALALITAHRRTPARSTPVASTSSSRLPTITSAPAGAWSARAAISTPSDSATAHTVVAPAKPITPPAVAATGSAGSKCG